MLRDRAMLVQVGGLALLAALCSPEAGRTQGTPAPAPAVATPIGKVVTAKGAITIEHVDAMIVQANLPANAEQPKAGDLVYKGDIVATGADSAIGITFADGTAFNLSSNARMVLNEFVYDPNGKSNSTLVQSQQRDVHFHCRQDRQDRRHENRHAGGHHGNSRHYAARGNLLRRRGDIQHAHRGQEGDRQNPRRLACATEKAAA
jgi:hypothetical protein